MRVSVSGTRRGWTPEQQALMADVLAHADELTHGGCVGVDRQAHDVFGRPASTRIFPSSDEQERWARRNSSTSHIHYILPALARNIFIIEAGDILYAVPRLMKEETRSGTWHAIRYARRKSHPYLIVWPDGSVGTDF